MLKIRDEVDLKELEKFDFKYIEEENPTHDCLYGSRKESPYIEKKYVYDNSDNSIEIVLKRENSDWIHPSKEREIYISQDYDMGITKETVDKIYDLIQAGYVEKVEE